MKPNNRQTSALVVLALLATLFQFSCDREKGQGTSSSPATKTELTPLTNMVWIKPGTFVRAKHLVTLTRDYWLGKYEVTQGEYSGLTGRNPSHFKEDPNCPVEKVSFYDAMAYCAVLTERERQSGRLPIGYEYRLPLEAEWEYACRAGTTNLFSFGDSTAEASQYAWTAENSDGKPHPIGQKRPNPWGLHDMHGNVWEWCLDWFEPFPNADLQDPAGPPIGKFKVFHGGGWNNDIEYARSANRFMMSPTNGIHFVGFRVALSKIIKPIAPAIPK